jgi:hypothetical protein
MSIFSRKFTWAHKIWRYTWPYFFPNFFWYFKIYFPNKESIYTWDKKCISEFLVLFMWNALEIHAEVVDKFGHLEYEWLPSGWPWRWSNPTSRLGWPRVRVRRSRIQTELRGMARTTVYRHMRRLGQGSDAPWQRPRPQEARVVEVVTVVRRGSSIPPFLSDGFGGGAFLRAVK